MLEWAGKLYDVCNFSQNTSTFVFPWRVNKWVAEAYYLAKWKKSAFHQNKYVP